MKPAVKGNRRFRAHAGLLTDCRRVLVVLSSHAAYNIGVDVSWRCFRLYTKETEILIRINADTLPWALTYASDMIHAIFNIIETYAEIVIKTRVMFMTSKITEGVGRGYVLRRSYDMDHRYGFGMGTTIPKRWGFAHKKYINDKCSDDAV